MKQSKFFWFENPNGGRDVKIYFDEVEDVAQERNDNRTAEDMDDSSFFFYVNILLERNT